MSLAIFMVVLILFVAWAIVGALTCIEWDLGNADDAKLWKVVIVSGIMGGPILFIICLVGKIIQMINMKGIPRKINEWLSK